jgi:hypothetical protein
MRRIFLNIPAVFSLLAIAFFAFHSIAQDATPVPAVAAIQSATNAIPESFPIWVGVVLSWLLSEVVMRKWPTAKPKSWFLVGKSMANAMANLFLKIEKLFDWVIGQNLK